MTMPKKIQSILVVYYVGYKKTMEHVRDVLDVFGAQYKTLNRRRLSHNHFSGKDFIIVVGGDGTFLRTSHYIKDVPVLGVCYNTNVNEGFYARSWQEDFRDKFALVAAGKFKIINLLRLQGYVNGKSLFPALNEYYIGSEKPYYTARYMIRIGNKKEFQKSSGVVVATPSGSYGWMKSAGGKLLPLGSRNYQYLVREPYKGRLSNTQLSHGILSEKQKLVIESNIDRGIVAVDSYKKDYMFETGSVFTVGVYKHPLRLVYF